MNNMPVIHVHSREPVDPAPVQSAENVPARVRTAMHIIEHFTEKTASKALPTKCFDPDSPITYEALAGQKLTEEERELLAEAAKLLTQYCQGRMDESALEKRDRAEAKKVREEANAGALPMVISCPNCGGHPIKKNECFLCRAGGQIRAGLVR